MDTEYIRQHDIIDRYLLGKLSEEEVVQFEEYCLMSESTFKELQIAEQLMLGVKSISGEDWDRLLLTESTHASAGILQDRARGDWRSILKLPSLFPMAASFLIGVLGTFLMIESPIKSLPTSAVMFELSAVREVPVEPASQPVNIVRLGVEPETVVLIVPVSGYIDTKYQASVLDGQGQELFSIENLKLTGPAKEVMISVNSEVFRAGNYSLKVSDSLFPQEVDDLRFTVIRD